MTWYDAVRVSLYILWGVMILLIVKILARRRRWRHPLRGNGPMLWALLLVLVATEITRAQNIGTNAPPPYVPSLACTIVATLLICYWLWRQLELIPAWIRRHLPWKRTRSDYTLEEHDRHARKRR